MTTCCRSSVIKSSVYNQTGEGFFQQLTAYNHMTAHLRRILLAKSRVDSRNPSYVQRQQRSRCLSNDKSCNKSISQEFIDRIAYDTEHHPMDILRMGCNYENREKNSRSQDRSRKYNTCNSSYIECPGSRINSATIRQLESERSRSMSRTRIYGSGPTFHSARPGRCQRKSSSWRSRDEVDADGISSRRGGPISVNSSIRSSPRSSESKNDNDPACFNYASSFESSSDASRRGSPVPKLSAPSPSPVDSTMSTQRQRNTFEETSTNFNKNDEDAKYSKFLYDITQEIVQHGFYTDEELRNVFKKHIKNNLHILDKDKMMDELYQLKLSLNIIDHEDEEESGSMEQLLRSNRKFSRISTPKPPTPPKILDENKLMDKLLSEDELKEVYSKSPANGRNAVVLIDANPELLITERDILATLMEMNIEPQRAQSVYKRLQKKSRDLSNPELVHPETQNTVRRSSIRRVTPEQHKIQSSHQDIQNRGRYPMNTKKYHIMGKDESIINQDWPSMVTLKSPHRGKRPNPRPDDHSNGAGKNRTKMCQCERRVLEVKLPRTSDGCRTLSERPSIKSKYPNDKKLIEAKEKKNKEPKELIDNQLAYTSTRVSKRKTSSLSQLEGLQSDRMRTDGMKKNIGDRIEIESFDPVQHQSALKAISSSHNSNEEDIKIEHANPSMQAQPTSSNIRAQQERDNAMKLSNNVIEGENAGTVNSLPREFDDMNEIHEYIPNDPDGSVTESIDDDVDDDDYDDDDDDDDDDDENGDDDDGESIDEENLSHIVAKSNNESTLESDVESDVEQINNSVQYDIDGIIGGNTSTESQFQTTYGNKTLIKFPTRETIINTETQVDINRLSPDLSRICLCERDISINNRENNGQSQWHEYFYDKNNNGLCDIKCPNANNQVVIDTLWEQRNSMVLCESCENIATCIHD